jgi:hypothetical protein
MTATEQVQLPPIEATIDNPEEWGEISQQIASETGTPTAAVTLEALTGMVGSAVPLLFEADSSGNADLLRGTFADAVVAQCQRNAGCLHGDKPTSATVHLVGAPMRSGQPVLRVHVLVATRTPDGTASVNSQFWDVQMNVQVTIGQATCPSCGAPLSRGQLICDHCHTDVRNVVDVPLVVSRLELY